MSAPEFDGQPMTKREILIARAAFVQGAGHEWDNANPRGGAADFQSRSARRREAAEGWYPLPKVTRPRVVVDSGGDEWTIHPSAGLQVRCAGLQVRYAYAGRKDGWKDPSGTDFLGFESTVADLLANPTEEVEDDS